MNRPEIGRFLSFEGGEGVGKSTQIAAVAEALRARGLTIVLTREPGGSAGAEAIRELLLHTQGDAWDPAAETLLFAAARSDHVARVIRPALARGEWVLCDRFVDSTRAYQGGGSGLDDAAIMAVHEFGCAGLLPDRTVLLSLDPARAGERRARRQLERPDRFESRSAKFHQRVANSFSAMAAADPARFRTIAAEGAVEAVTARIMTALEDLIP